MKRFARWARQFGLARAVCTIILFALVPLRIADLDLIQVKGKSSRRWCLPCSGGPK
jgi:hypothetical protein